VTRPGAYRTRQLQTITNLPSSKTVGLAEAPKWSQHVYNARLAIELSDDETEVLMQFIGHWMGNDLGWIESPNEKVNLEFDY
jgi:hypothetical protein